MRDKSKIMQYLPQIKRAHRGAGNGLIEQREAMATTSLNRRRRSGSTRNSESEPDLVCALGDVGAGKRIKIYPVTRTTCWFTARRASWKFFAPLIEDDTGAYLLHPVVTKECEESGCSNGVQYGPGGGQIKQPHHLTLSIRVRSLWLHWECAL